MKNTIVIFPPMDNPGELINNIIRYIAVKLKNKPLSYFQKDRNLNISTEKDIKKFIT